MRKPVVMWMIEGRLGDLLPWTCSESREDAIDQFAVDNEDWQRLEKEGCRVVKVRVEEITE